jgi:hypothetical protein
MLANQPKVDMIRASFLERRASKSTRKKVIPLTGQGHVYMLAPGRYGVVLFLLGGTNSCGGRRWYAILKESKINTLLAILLVDVAPVDSVDFPRRTHYFCKQGPEMDEALNSASELAAAVCPRAFQAAAVWRAPGLVRGPLGLPDADLLAPRGQTRW